MEPLMTLSAVFANMAENRDCLNSRLSETVRDLPLNLLNQVLERRSRLLTRRMIRRELRRLHPACGRRAAFRIAVPSLAA